MGAGMLHRPPKLHHILCPAYPRDPHPYKGMLICISDAEGPAGQVCQEEGGVGQLTTQKVPLSGLLGR